MGGVEGWIIFSNYRRGRTETEDGNTAHCATWQTQYSTVKYSTVQYSTVQCSTIKYSTVEDGIDRGCEHCVLCHLALAHVAV